MQRMESSSSFDMALVTITVGASGTWLFNKWRVGATIVVEEVRDQMGLALLVIAAMSVVSRLGPIAIDIVAR